jgi:hypothetical protein
VTFESVHQAILILSDPSHPSWGDAFDFLSRHPETAGLMLETFRDTLHQMGLSPSGTDPATREATYGLTEVARTLGVLESDLDASAQEQRQCSAE